MSSIPALESSESRADFKAMVAEAAYYKAEQRGFAPGFEMADWLEAERELSSIVEPAPKTKRKANGSPRKVKKKAK